MKARESVSSSLHAGNIDVAKWYLERKKKNEFSPRQESKIDSNVKHEIPPIIVTQKRYDEVVDKLKKKLDDD